MQHNEKQSFEPRQDTSQNPNDLLYTETQHLGGSQDSSVAEVVPYIYAGNVVGNTLHATAGKPATERTPPLGEQAEVTSEEARLALASIAKVDPRTITSAESMDTAFRDLAPALTKVIPELFGGAENVSAEHAGYQHGGFLDLGTTWRKDNETTILSVSYLEDVDVDAPWQDTWKAARDQMASGAAPLTVRLQRIRKDSGRSNENVKIHFASDNPHAPSAGWVEVSHDATYPSTPDAESETISAETIVGGNEAAKTAGDYSLAAFGISRLAEAVLARDQALMSENAGHL